MTTKSWDTLEGLPELEPLRHDLRALTADEIAQHFHPDGRPPIGAAAMCNVCGAYVWGDLEKARAILVCGGPIVPMAPNWHVPNYWGVASAPVHRLGEQPASRRRPSDAALASAVNALQDAEHGCQDDARRAQLDGDELGAGEHGARAARLRQVVAWLESL